MAHAHSPQVPSQLRESHTVGSPETSGMLSSTYQNELVESPPAIDDYDRQNIETQDHQPTKPDQTSVTSDPKAKSDEGGIIPTLRSRLFGRRHGNYSSDSVDGTSIFRPAFYRSYGSVATMNTFDSRLGYAGPYRDDSGSGNLSPNGLLGEAGTEGLLGERGQHTGKPKWFAKRHGSGNDGAMYVANPNLLLLHSSILSWSHSASSNTYCRQVSKVLSPDNKLDPSVSLEVCPR